MGRTHTAYYTLCTEIIRSMYTRLQAWNDTKSVSKLHLFHYPPVTCEGTWRAMSSTLTAVLSVGNTQYVHPCVTKKTATSPNLKPAFFIYLQCTLTDCDTAGAGQHRLSRSAPSRTADVAVAQPQNDFWFERV
jgi:hypothetical protein